MARELTIRIRKELKEQLPHFGVIAFSMNVNVENSDIIKEAIAKKEKEILEKYTLEDVLKIPLIKEARDAYKALGKDPSRYRLACESLLRRLVKGQGLYLINNVVDAGNLLSIGLFRSTAILDLDKIVGDVYIRLGTEEDEYYGIGRGLINVSNIPLYCDEISPFGSPTSDTERTMITPSTKNILVMAICFSENREGVAQTTIDMFKTYASAQNIKEIVVLEGDE